MAHQLSELQSKYTQHTRETAFQQEELNNKLSECKKEKKFIMKQLKRLEQLYTSREKTHAQQELDYSKLSQLFHLLRDNNIFQQIPDYHKMVDRIYSNHTQQVNNTSPILLDLSSIYGTTEENPHMARNNDCKLKRSNSVGTDLKGILKNYIPSQIPKSSTPNSSQYPSPNVAYTASKHKQWLPVAENQTSDVL